jgi:23S rRNA pseudoU1915 N3-methylase RlmH
MDNSVMDNVSDTTQAQVQETAQQAQERLFKQSELNEIVGRAKHDAVESFKRQQQTQYAQQAPQSNQAQSSKSLSEDDVKRLTSEELARQRDQWTRESQEKADADIAQRIVNSYKEKIAPGKEKYEDFEAVTNNVDMRYYPNVVQLLAEYVDNSHDVIYELAKNRTKLYQLESTCGHNPQDAIYEIKRLSDSIKANESSSQMKHANSPLSQQRPSNTGTDSGGTLSMKDLKRKYKA